MPPINSFTAIDFETAQGKRWSVCQVGIVRVENGKVVDKFESLIKPPENIYFPMNIRIHGITPKMTASAPTFKLVWNKIKPFIHEQNVVAHNGAFDFSCVKQSLEFYSLEHPEYNQHCTLKIYGEGLSPLCDRFGIELNHHDALSDAMACAKLFLMHLKNGKEGRQKLK